MARFKLLAPHYLNVPGNQWEYKEVDRTTGKEKRKLSTVPMYLHPEQQSDWNYIVARLPNGQVADGEIVVSTKEDPNFPQDIVFVGNPTPDMEPVDDEAKVIMASLQGKWKHPIESLPGTFAEQLPIFWQQQIEASKTQAQNISTGELDKLRQQNNDLNNQLAELRAIVEAIAATPVSPGQGRRALA